MDSGVSLPNLAVKWLTAHLGLIHIWFLWNLKREELNSPLSVLLLLQECPPQSSYAPSVLWLLRSLCAAEIIKVLTAESDENSLEASLADLHRLDNVTVLSLFPAFLFPLFPPQAHTHDLYIIIGSESKAWLCLRCLAKLFLNFEWDAPVAAYFKYVTTLPHALTPTGFYHRQFNHWLVLMTCGNCTVGKNNIIEGSY